MKDITNDIEKAMSQNILWSVNDFFSVLELLQHTYVTSFWEGEENWATIILDNNVIAYLWQMYPVIICIKQNTQKIKSELMIFNYIIFIEAENFKNKEFKFDYKYLNINTICVPSSEIFSADDIWFYTNSI